MSHVKVIDQRVQNSKSIFAMIVRDSKTIISSGFPSLVKGDGLKTRCISLRGFKSHT